MGYNVSYKTPLSSTTEYGIVKVGTGISVTDGVISGSTGLLNYGFFTDTTTQTNPVANAINIATLNTTGPANGVSIVGGTDITVVDAGTYTKLFTLIISKTAGGTTAASIWLQQSPPGGPFVDVPGSRQDLDLTNTLTLTFTSGNYTLNLPAGGAIRLCWSSADTTMAISALPAAVTPTRPAGDCLKITLTRIS